MNTTDSQAFVEAFSRYVAERLREEGVASEYIQEAVEIVDARNGIFRSAGFRNTAEEENIYAIRDVLWVNPDTLETEINFQRLERIAHQYFY